MVRVIRRFAMFGMTVAALVAGWAEASSAAGNPRDVDEDFAVQGEYVGKLTAEGERDAWGAQVIALGDGKFRGVGYQGGLPGDGWNGYRKEMAEGRRSGDKVVLYGNGFTLNVGDGTIVVTSDDGQQMGTMKKTHRRSETLNSKPPPNAVVLFDGTTADNFEGGRLTDEGLLAEGVVSKQRFGDFSCHLEFRLPYMPDARGQGRANSGFYVQGRYEIQILDSFGLDGRDNECGGIYQIAEPETNMCLPPLSWQTYDVDFVAARFEGDRKVRDARITVRHNGVTIHDNLALPHVTGGNLIPDNDEPGPVYLQDHGNPVRFRNIWVVPGE